MSHSQSQTILVTGATGRHGWTSAHAVGELLKAGRHVRVLARSESKRTQALSSLGAEIVFGDFNDRASLVAALNGVETATFTYPIAGGVVNAAANFASAARESRNPPRIVVMSMAVAQSSSPSHLGRAQWLAEEVLSWAASDLCILRIAALFFENLAILHAREIRETSAFANTFGNAAVPWISGLDAGRLLVAAILRRDLFAGQAVHYPPGSELYSHAEIADMLSHELGRTIRFDPIDRETWAATLCKVAEEGRDSLVNADMAGHISAVGDAIKVAAASIRNPSRDEVQRLIGTAPLSL